MHGLLFDTPLLNTLFYGLPNLVFLAFMLLSIAVVWSGALPRVMATLLLIDWAAVLLGNLVHPIVQRVAIIMLGVIFLPFALRAGALRSRS